MAKQQIKITMEEESTLQSMASIIHAGGKTYFFMPYWFEKTDKPGVYILHSLEHSLPKDLIEVIKSNRK